MKPDTRTAMADLIHTIRQVMPFEEPDTWICSGKCHGCSLKLLEYLDTQLEGYEYHLEAGDVPHFGDLKRLVNTSKKIYQALYKSGLFEKTYDEMIASN